MMIQCEVLPQADRWLFRGGVPGSDGSFGCLQHFTVDITALVNDTVGTLASAQYGDARHNTDTCISIIVGTGGAPCQLVFALHQT